MSRVVNGYSLGGGDVFIVPGEAPRVRVAAHTEPSPPGTRRVVTTDAERLTFTPHDTVTRLDPAGTLGAVIDAVLGLEPGQRIIVWRDGPEGGLYL